MMRRRDVIGLLAAAALPWPRPARASQALLDESVGFAAQVLFLAIKTPALVVGVVRDGQTLSRASAVAPTTRTRRQAAIRCSGSARQNLAGESLRRSGGSPALRSANPCCNSIAQRTASTTLRNSTIAPSPVRLTTRPRCMEFVGSTRSLLSVRKRAKIRSSSAPASRPRLSRI